MMVAGPAKADELPRECRPTDSRKLQMLYDDTEASVHELVTCGGIQMKVALSMKVMIFASNEELVSPSARSDLRSVVEAVGMTVDNPFTRGEDGSWTMETAGNAGSSFSLEFHDPETGELVTVDPFRLDSYLPGASVTSSRTWGEMKANPTMKNTFTYSWTELGPLGHLLEGGGDVPNPFTLRMSLADLGGALLGLGDVDYGPFDGVQDLLVESRIHMVDDRSVAKVAYDVTGRRDSVRNLVDAASLSYDVDFLTSTDGTLSLTGDADGLAFLARGQLAGELYYGVTGSRAAAISIVSDFGGGQAYPTPRWECR